MLPRGGGLPPEVWEQRHTGLVILMWLNAVGLAIFGYVKGFGLGHSLAEAGIVAAAAVIAGFTSRNHLLASAMATIGLLSASAILVHFSEGSIEAHVHFFVMVTIIILYQDWVPFLLAIAYVVAHHALFGLMSPTSVFNHSAAIDQPVKWALIHGLFILGATIAGLTVWKQNEQLRDSYQKAARDLAAAETRQRDAFELNDNVLQHLAIADYSFELGMEDKGRAALKRSLVETQKIVSELLANSGGELEPGDLVRKTASVPSEVPA